MDNKRIGVVLSSDLKNSVIVNGETWEEVEELMPKARALYASLIEEFGIKTYGGKPSGQTSPSRGYQPTSSGESVSCADCGEALKGKKDQKSGKFQTPAEVAEWGQKKYGRPLCLANVNDCYRKAAGQGSAPARAASPARRSSRPATPADELDF